MDAIDPRLHSYLVSQGLAPRPREARGGEAPAPALPTESFRQVGADEPGLLRKPVGTPRAPEGPPAFDFPSDEESILRMDALRKEGLADELRQIRKELKAQKKEASGLQERAQVHGGLKDVGSALERMEQAHRTLKWSQVTAGLEGEVSPTYRSYFVNGKTPIAEMTEVLRTARSLEDPDSPMRSRGNSVKPLVRDEIWKAKMARLEEAARNPAPGGEPVQIDAEYYELASADMLEKLTRASRGGAEVRVLIDPGGISRMSGTPDATSLASRLNTLKRLDEGSNGRVAVQLFANKEVLGGRDEIMHRKQLRVGDTVVFGGMNANEGSGENVDFGMEIRGPATAEFVQTFKDDVERSRGRDVDAIYGRHLADLRETEGVVVQGHGLLALIESQIPGGPKAGETYAQRVDRVLENAAFAGVRPEELAEIPGGDVRAWLLEGHGPATLTERGRNLLADGLEGAVGRINGERNQAALQRIPPPDTARAGDETVAVGDSSVERQAMLLHAIDSAERHIKVSAFVLNEDIARLLAEKKERMEAQGRPFDVQVVMDPGIYPHGGSPNEPAYKLLEDRGVPVRWAALDRTSEHHDRKVHAKLILTDKMMVAGSTNFSHKGLRDNWELSDVTFFTEDAESRADREKVEADFQRLWDRESLAIDTRGLAQREHGDRGGAEGEYLRDSHRKSTLRAFLRGIGNLEKDIGRKVGELQRTDPILAYTVEQRVREGESRGYALLQAVGDERLDAIRHGSPAWRSLQSMASGND